LAATLLVRHGCDTITPMRRLIRSQLLVFAFASGCISSLSGADPAWFGQPQFFTFYNGYFFQPDPGLAQVPFTGQAFGVYIYPTAYPPVVSDDSLRSEVNAWKSQGKTYFFASDLLFWNDNTVPPGWDAFQMRNIDGQIVNLGGSNGFYTPLQIPQFSLSSPVFQSALKAAVVRAVDLGADGIDFDDAPGQIQSIIGYGPHDAGSFDSVTMGAFRTYLQQKYSASALLAQFGIADITNFDFGVYINANSLTETWNQQPLTGLSREFFLFKRQESVNFFSDLVTSTKQYSQQKYGRDFLFAFNDNDYPPGFFLTESMDMEYAELPYIRGGDHPFGAVDIKAWKGWKNGVMPKPLAMAASFGAANPLSKATVNLERVLIADQAAAGAMAGTTLQMNEGPIGSEPVDLGVVSRYANFILDNGQLMVQTKTTAQTLLLESAGSLLGGLLSAPAETQPWNSPTDYFGTARLLLDSGITYDSLFLPDTSYSQLPSLALGALTPYKVVIAPYSWALDDYQVSVLLAYAQQGGTLIVDGSFANSQPDGTPASRPDIQTILATPGAQPYGSGIIVVTNAVLGVQYETDDMTTQRTARAAFQSFLAPYISPDVIVTQPPAQIHEPGIAPFFYRDRNGNALVHLVNYDYDDNSDQFYTITNIQVQVRVGSQPVNAVILRSPDMAEAQSLPFTRNGNTITTTVPTVDAWDVLYFEVSTLAPVIDSATPAPALGAAGGNSLPFSVQASDSDGNPLTYTWSVNGQAVTDVSAPSYTLPLPLTASGSYTVTVTVSDGLRITQTSWTVNVAAYRMPRVLFDETHNEQDSIDPTRASQVNPQYPGLALFGTLNQALQGNYQTSRLVSGAITPQNLATADVLVVSAPLQDLTTAEDQAISSFVQDGGGLIFLGVRGEDNSINTLLSPWGVQFDGTLIESTQNSCCPQAFQLDTFADHPALGSNPFYWIDWAGSLTVSPPAVVLGQTGSDSWKSVSGQPTEQPSDPAGPLVIIAAAQPSKGRIFALSNNAFDDLDVQAYPRNVDLFLSALAWVSSPANPPASTPLPVTTSIFSVVNGATFAGAISPGSWVTIFGQNLSNVPASGELWTASDFNGNALPTTLRGTSAWINGRQAAVEFISPNQVNVQAPDDTYSGTVLVQVISPSGLTTGTANLQSIAPALFTVASGGSTYAAAVGLDGLLIAPPNQIPGARAAKSGETLQLYGTGFGDTNPHQPSGQLVSVAPVVAPVSASVCDQPAEVSFTGLVGPGLDQINITLPTLPPGNCPVQIVVGGVRTQSGILIPIGE